jgi:hypothetical protein
VLLLLLRLLLRALLRALLRLRVEWRLADHHYVLLHLLRHLLLLRLRLLLLRALLRLLLRALHRALLLLLLLLGAPVEIRAVLCRRHGEHLRQLPDRSERKDELAPHSKLQRPGRVRVAERDGRRAAVRGRGRDGLAGHGREGRVHGCGAGVGPGLRLPLAGVRALRNPAARVREPSHHLRLRVVLGRR